MSRSEERIDLLPPESVPGVLLAWSETHLEQTLAGAPAIALWRPRGTAVAIGVSQSSEYDTVPETIRRDGVSLVRRPSGGGSVVLCAGVLCWEAWADLEDVKRLSGGDNGIRPAYAVLSMPAVNGLRALGVDAFQAGISDIAVNVDNTLRKLAGTAQLRRRNKTLVHGSLLVNADLSLLGRYLPNPDKAPDYRAGREHDTFCANVSSLLSDASDAMATVSGQIRKEALSLGWEVLLPPAEMPPDVEKLAREKYLAPGWNWEKIRPGNSKRNGYGATNEYTL